MRSLILACAFAIAAAGAPALAQEDEMARAERELRDAMAPAASQGAVVERVAPDEIRVRMPSDITFDFNRAELRYEFMPRIRDLAQTLSRHPGMQISVIGHADAIGSDGYNQALSERRAYSVADALVQYGVTGRRIDATGRGEWEPIASNSSEWGRSRNRRVEISVKAAK
jgi:outer membrane protein OmpA-like peptidoglycan-associated protein